MISKGDDGMGQVGVRARERLVVDVACSVVGAVTREGSFLKMVRGRGQSCVLNLTG